VKRCARERREMLVRPSAAVPSIVATPAFSYALQVVASGPVKTLGARTETLGPNLRPAL
jgi:hypothetical protein